MARAMRYRDIHRSLVAAGCTWTDARGSHEKWYCPCGEHIPVVPNHREVSPGVVADIVKKLSCLPKGWLQ